MRMKNSIKLSAVSMLCLVLCSVLPPSARAQIPIEPEDSLAEMQAKIDRNGWHFTVSTNWVFNLPNETKARLFSRGALGTMSRRAVDSGAGPLLVRTAEELPASYDWRNVNGHTYIGPVRDQGSCGACYSFGAAAAAEGSYNRVMNLYDSQCVDFSEGWIAWCLPSFNSSYASHFDGCNGADYDYMELQALCETGITYEANIPYTEYNPGTCSPDVPLVKFKSWHRVDCGDINAIKTAIMQYGVVDAAVYVNNAFQAYSSGIYTDTNTNCPQCEYTQSNHAISLIGWDDNNGDGYWILRNSWGTTWGENGYMRISYRAATVACAVTYLVYEGTGPAATTDPESSVTATSATLNGRVNPNGASTTCYFDYGTTPSFGQRSASDNAGSGSSAISVSIPVTGLTSETVYYFRMVASNQNGVAYGATETLTTLGDPKPPTVLTADATNILWQSATLQGSVNPNGAASSFYFEYGTISAPYTSRTAPQSAGSGMDPQSVSAAVTGLTSATTYTFRLCATNEYGLSQCIAKSFLTGTPDAPDFGSAAPSISGITANSAIFTCTFSPSGSSADAWFEYGTSMTMDTHSAPQSFPATYSNQLLTLSVTDLAPQTTYFLRGAATNAAGSAQSAFTSFTTSPQSDNVFEENFENDGSIPSTFTTSGTFTWTCADGSSYSSGKPPSAHSGSYNAILSDAYSESPDEYGDLISRPIDFGSKTNDPKLVFWHCQNRWQFYQDELAVYYRAAPADDWKQLARYTNDVSRWTKRTLPLPNPSSTYQICFRGFPDYGDGVCIDDVLVSASPSTPTPPVSTLSATSITATDATLNAVINPDGAPTLACFIYGTDNLFNQTSAWTSVGSGTTDTSLTTRISTLQPATPYTFRAVATNSGGISYGNIATFSTASASAQPPQINDLSADSITATGAILRASVTPNGAETICTFHLGTTNTPPEPLFPAITISSSNSTASIQQLLTSLSPTHTYTYTLTASNLAGTSTSTLHSFTTTENTDLPLLLNFDASSALPTGWSNSYQSAQSIPWRIATEDLDTDTPAPPPTGTNFVLMYFEGYETQTTRLCSPPINFGSLTNSPRLTFYHLQRSWYGDQDQLAVYCRTGTSDWQLLTSFTNEVSSWTRRTLSLPHPDGPVYLAFEGRCTWGYGIGIDAIQLTASSTPSTNSTFFLPYLLLLQ